MIPRNMHGQWWPLFINHFLWQRFFVKSSTVLSGAAWWHVTCTCTCRSHKGAFKKLYLNGFVKNWMNYKYNLSVFKRVVSEANRECTRRYLPFLSAWENRRARFRYLTKRSKFIPHDNLNASSMAVSYYSRRRNLKFLGLELKSRFRNSLRSNFWLSAPSLFLLDKMNWRT